MSSYVETEFEVSALPEVVWSLIEDFDAYSSWNRTWTGVSGKPRTGSRIRIERADGSQFAAVIRAADRPYLLRVERCVIPFLLCCEYRVQIEPKPGRKSRVHLEAVYCGLFRGRVSQERLNRDLEDMFAFRNAMADVFASNKSGWEQEAAE